MLCAWKRSTTRAKRASPSLLHTTAVYLCFQLFTCKEKSSYAYWKNSVQTCLKRVTKSSWWLTKIYQRTQGLTPPSRSARLELTRSWTKTASKKFLLKMKHKFPQILHSTSTKPWLRQLLTQWAMLTNCFSQKWNILKSRRTLSIPMMPKTNYCTCLPRMKRNSAPSSQLLLRCNNSTTLPTMPHIKCTLTKGWN